MSAILSIVPTATAAVGWRERIQAAWQKSVAAIIETGRLLSEAKAALPHGEFTAMIATDLPFNRKTAHKLMAIAADDRIVSHGRQLPAAWTTLYELTRLPDKTFDAKLKDGTINPRMERKHVAALLSTAIRSS